MTDENRQPKYADATTVPLYISETVVPVKMACQLTGQQPRWGTVQDVYELPAWANQWEHYHHEGLWANRLIFGDPSPVMRTLINDEGQVGQVQTVLVRQLDDTDEDTTREQLRLCRELLAETGSIFVEANSAQAMVRLGNLCNEVFHESNHLEDLIKYSRKQQKSAPFLGGTTGYIWWYAKDKDQAKCIKLYESRTLEEQVAESGDTIRVEIGGGGSRSLTKEERTDPTGHFKGNELYALRELTTSKGKESNRYGYDYEGTTYHPGRTRYWSGSAGYLDSLAEQGRLEGDGTKLRVKRYLQEQAYTEITDRWDGYLKLRGKEKRNRAQTYKLVVKQCLMRSSDPGDLVLDITVGSGDRVVVAEEYGRRWWGIVDCPEDLGETRRQLLTEVYPWYKIVHGGRDPSAGFETETFQRVTPTLLAAEMVGDPKNVVCLVDQPREDANRVRLAGPFVVEKSTTNYISFADDNDADEASTDLIQATVTNVEQMVRALWAVPIKTKFGSGTLRVGDVTAIPDAEPVTHLAECTFSESEERFRAGVVVVPLDVSATPDMIDRAVTELRRRAEDLEHLIVMAGIFENSMEETIDSIGVIKVTPSDLQVSSKGSPTTSEPSPATKFGGPDVRCEWANCGKMVIVKLLGYDEVNPVNYRSRHSPAEGVDRWEIDTDYARKVFFPRLGYSPGAREDPKTKKQLTKQLGGLKVSCPEEKVEALCGYVSEPFVPPQEGNRIAVRIILRTGAEMTVVVDAPA